MIAIQTAKIEPGLFPAGPTGRRRVLVWRPLAITLKFTPSGGASLRHGDNFVKRRRLRLMRLGA